MLDVSNFAPYTGSIGKVHARRAWVHDSCLQGCYGCVCILYVVWRAALLTYLQVWLA